jgi:hypothetical protein
MVKNVLSGKGSIRMKISPRATPGHLIAGMVLIGLSVLSLFGCAFLDIKWADFLVFFFGVWGGVELGRYLEFSLSKK